MSKRRDHVPASHSRSVETRRIGAEQVVELDDPIRERIHRHPKHEMRADRRQVDLQARASAPWTP